MKLTAIVGFVIIFGFFIGFVGYVTDFDYIESKLLSVLFPTEKHDFPLIQDVPEKIPAVEPDEVKKKVPLWVINMLNHGNDHPNTKAGFNCDHGHMNRACNSTVNQITP